MIYFVTYAFMGSELGANPFRHAFLLLSKLEPDQNKIEVVDHWGFYGLPSTMPPSLFEAFKKKIGLNIDLKGNHGLLRHEKVRYLDQGHGLHGVSFELSKDKFTTLQKRCKDIEQAQYEAIAEATNGLKGQATYKYYPQEALSPHIYALEEAKAREQKRPSRLSPFEVRWSARSCLNRSYTCKSEALRILSDILSPEQIAHLSKDGWNQAIPRYSGPMERIFLHSEGPLKPFTKNNGQVVYNRDEKSPDTKLYWTLPPQQMDFIHPSTKAQFILPCQAQETKAVVKKLQRLEWLFNNTPVKKKYQPYINGLIKEIQRIYNTFSDAQTKKQTHPNYEFKKGFLRFLHPFSSPAVHRLQYKIEQANEFLNALYMTMVNNEKIDDSYPCETSVDADYDGLFNPVERIASHLSPRTQKALCHIIGRTYITPSSSLEVQPAPFMIPNKRHHQPFKPKLPTIEEQNEMKPAI